MLMLTLGSPASVAIAGSLKLMPGAGRRLLDRPPGAPPVAPPWRLGSSALGLFQLVLEPAATLAYIRLEWLNGAFALPQHLAVCDPPGPVGRDRGRPVVLSLRYAPTRYGWPFAVALSVFAYPRLLVYQLLTLLAAFGGPPARRARTWRRRSARGPADR